MKKTCKCAEVRKKARGNEEKRLLLNRLSRIEGQIRGIRSMVEEDVYCPDILMQVSAVSSALSAFSRELLSEHINTCVKGDILENKDGAAEELSELLKSLLR